MIVPECQPRSFLPGHLRRCRGRVRRHPSSGVRTADHRRCCPALPPLFAGGHRRTQLLSGAGLSPHLPAPRPRACAPPRTCTCSCAHARVHTHVAMAFLLRFCCGSLKSASAWLVRLLGHVATPGSAFPVTPIRSSEPGSVESPAAGQRAQERTFVGGRGRGGEWRGRGWLSALLTPPCLGTGRGLWRPPCAHAAQCERGLGAAGLQTQGAPPWALGARAATTPPSVGLGHREQQG